MARAHKGERAAFFPYLRPDVHDYVQNAAAAAGVSVSVFIADIMAVSVGRFDLIDETPVAHLPLVTLAAPQRRNQRADEGEKVTTRLAGEVVGLIKLVGAQPPGGRGKVSMAVYIADTVTAAAKSPLQLHGVGRPTPSFPVQEVLTLAV
ncbi:hypothetical protein [Mycolicibacterium llatzerense]|uniref:hypothetical protein n=1 Tax=Mycolicibacterium llatzerense TaxID=280871 RepID=UPI0008DE4603|nr:hypothetical protein [Mycolicibacterium llatzerense]